MFKCKVAFAAFKSDTVDQAKTKVLLKAAIKKLAAPANIGQRAPYYMIKDYYKDEAGTPIGDFLCVGIEKGMMKHFRAIECKPGKPALRKSADPKSASMGEVYVKEENGTSLVCFEPVPACKMKAPVYTKAFKKMKAMFGGRKGIVIMNGQAPADAAPADAAPAAGDAATPIGGEPTTVGAAPAAQGPASLAQLAQEISTGLKTTIPNQIIPNIKAKQSTAEDLAVIESLLGSMDSFKGVFPTASAEEQTKLQSMATAVQNQYPNIQKLKAILETQLSGATTATGPVGISPELEALLKRAANNVQNVSNNKAQLYETLANAPEPELKGGADMLDTLGI